MVRDEVNRGKAERLNRGFALAGDELVVVTDADTHMHPVALRAPRREDQPLAAPGARSRALPTSPTGRTYYAAMQILEAASIIRQVIGARSR